MKKYSFLVLLSVLIGGIGLSWSANTCTNTDQACYVIGSSQNPTTVYRIDASGNVTNTANITVTGTAAHTGPTVYTRSQTVAITSTTVILPTSTYMIVASTGGLVTCGLGLNGTAAAPCISTSTAVDGQYLVIGATQTTNPVAFSSATASGMDLGSASRTVQYGKILTLIFDGINSIWREVSYGNN